MNGSIQHFFDWNSTSPPAEEVLVAMQQAQVELWGNPSSVHGVGRRARAEVENTREVLALMLGVHPRDVLFTSGGTESNNLGLAAAKVLVTSRLEHPSVVRVAERLEQAGGRVVWAAVSAAGQVTVEALRHALQELGADARGAWVTVNAANHETGVVQPVQELCAEAHTVGARVHVDAVQWVGKRELAALRDADSVAIAAHKFRGPKGVGALLFRGTPPTPVLLGGAQERGFRPGTQDAAALVGFRVALERAQLGSERQERLRPLRDRLEEGLRECSQVNGVESERLAHVSSLHFPALPGPELVAALDLAGYCVSSGSACSAGTSEPSPVIQAMVGADQARSTIRVSLGEGTQENAVDGLITAIFSILRRQ